MNPDVGQYWYIENLLDTDRHIIKIISCEEETFDIEKIFIIQVIKFNPSPSEIKFWNQMGGGIPNPIPTVPKEYFNRPSSTYIGMTFPMPPIPVKKPTRLSLILEYLENNHD